MSRRKLVIQLTILSLLVFSVSPILADGPLDNYPRIITFSGYTWQIDTYSSPAFAEPTRDNPTSQKVFVDDQGRLHLSISYEDGVWWSTEAVLTRSLGYGTYTFHLASPINDLDPSAVLATFIWNQPPSTGPRGEIDIEYSGWGTANNPLRGQFAVQPTTTDGNSLDFVAPSTNASIQTIIWRPNYVRFISRDANGQLIRSWLYTGSDNPTPLQEHAVISFWVYPYGVFDTPSEFVIDSFEYHP